MTWRENVDEMLVVEVGRAEYNRVLAGPSFRKRDDYRLSAFWKSLQFNFFYIA